MQRVVMLALLCLLVPLLMAAYSEETQITVRVLSKDAKFIGTSMGGARVIVRDSETGAVLARGETSGSTGDTRRIITEPHRRYEPLSTDESARFVVMLDIDEPRLVTIEASGPLSKRQAAVSSSTEIWLIPGKHIVGDGVLLTLSGFVVDILEPVSQQRVKLQADSVQVAVQVNVTMMCGCPIEPEGLWDANSYEVSGTLKIGGKPAGSVPFAYAGQTSMFEATVSVREPGSYTLTVYAFDSKTGNSGVDKVSFRVLQ